MELLRPGLDPKILRSSDLAKTRDGAMVEVAGMVVARQRPETAKGIVFMLLEDERGTVNLIVPPPVYDRHRALVRAAPLLRAKGKLERREGTINVVVIDVAALEREEAPPPRSDHAARAELARSREPAVASAAGRSPSCARWRPDAGHMFVTEQR